VVPFVVNVMLL